MHFDVADGHAAASRVRQLRTLHRERAETNEVIRDVCSGGRRGLAAILGKGWNGDSASVPAANMILSGLTRLGQKIGRMPDLRVDLPHRGEDSDTARRKAERIRRIVVDYDKAVWLDGQVARVGLWLPAYGFASMAVVPGKTADGHPFPAVESRDPYSTYPGEFGHMEQPADCAWAWQWTMQRLRDWCQEHDRPDVWSKVTADRKRDSRGGIILDPSDFPGQGSSQYQMGGSDFQQGGFGPGVIVAEYRDRWGTWLVLPDHDQVLSHWPNPCDQPTFYVARRHTIGEIVGQYEHSFGLQSAMVKMNTLALIALEDATFAETNVEGQVLSGKYRRGRNATNHLERGSQVQVVGRSIPYQYFQEISRMEQQFRTTVGYPVTDDAISPAAQATGQGIERLNQPVDLEIKQYYDIVDRMIEHIDAVRLEWDEKMYGGMSKPLVGMRDGQPYAEMYRPERHIKGWYRTRRTHGAMAGLTDSAKLVGMLQLKGAGIVDSDTVREQLDGLGDVSLIGRRVKAEQAEQFLFQAMASGQPVDPRVAMTLIEMLPEGKEKAAFKKFWTPEDPAMSPEQEAMMAPPGAGPPGGGPPVEAGPPPDVQTMLARLTASGPQGGVQTVTGGR